PANNYAVVEFASINDVLRKRIVSAVSNGMPGLKHRQSIPVRTAVFPNSAITGELIRTGLCKQLCWSRSGKHGLSRGQKGQAQKIAAGCGIVHSGPAVRGGVLW